MLFTLPPEHPLPPRGLRLILDSVRVVNRIEVAEINAGHRAHKTRQVIAVALNAWEEIVYSALQRGSVPSVVSQIKGDLAA